MSYIKLGQIMINVSDELKYLETNDYEVVVNEPLNFPVKVSVEVIDWVSPEEENKQGKINSFNAEVVTLSEVPPVSIRDSVFDVLVLKYPGLLK